MEDISAGGNSAVATAPSSPTTFAEAFASETSPVSDPGAQDTSTLPAAASPGPDTASPQSGDDRSPYVDRKRFDGVNDRMKAAEEWRQRFAWAERDDVQQIIQMVSQSKGDPMAFFARQFADLAQHPTYSAQLRTFLGQQFGSLRQRQPAEPAAPAMPDPDVAIYDAHGQEVGRTYSAKTLAEREAFLKQQWLQEVTQSLAPDLQTLKTIQQERQQQAAEAQAHDFATSLLQEFTSIPGYDPKTHGPQLAAEVAKLQLAPDAHPAVVEAAARKALLSVVLPTLGQKAQSSLLDTLQKKAAANSSVNPGAAAPSASRSYTSFKDLPAEAWK